MKSESLRLNSDSEYKRCNVTWLIHIWERIVLRTIYYGFVISVGLYLLIGFTLFLITRGFPLETITMMAFGVAIMLLISAFPLYKTLYHGSKGANSTYTAYTPPDEHLLGKLQNDFESTQNKSKSNLGGIFICSAILMIIFSIILTLLFSD
jgi:ABC-type transport system involved in multi-copper enzyme maturation permease subunit